MTIGRTRNARWIPKATNTHTQTHTHRICNNYCFANATNGLHERASVLFGTYISCLVYLDFLHLSVCSTRSIPFYILCYLLEMCRMGGIQEFLCLSRPQHMGVQEVLVASLASRGERRHKSTRKNSHL